MTRRALGIAGSAVAAIALGLAYVARVLQHPFVVDDAYISFRYARHLAEGAGLVWNPGERVEGYTNFLWVVLLGAGMKAGLPPEPLARVVGTAAGLAVLATVAAFGARRSGWTSPIPWVAPALLVAIRPFSTWANGGLETMAFTALVTAGLTRFVVEREQSRSPFGSSLLLSLATLLRPDGALFLASAGALLAWEERAGRDRLRHALGFGAPILLVVAHVAFRWGYYGYPLPNTFYAKAEGARWFRGLRYFELFNHDTGLLYFAVPALVGALLRRERADRLFGAAIAAQTLYLLRVGGDIFDFRLLLPVLPLTAWLIADLPRSLPASPRVRAAGTALVLVTAGGVAVLRAQGTEDLPVRAGVASVRTMDAYARRRLDQGERLTALVQDGELRPDLRIATSGAGALPYVSGLYTVDVLGLNDVTIAHDAEPDPTARLGHEKRAWRAYLADRSVDMLDVAGGFVFPGRGPTRAVEQRATKRMNLFNRTPGAERLVLRCRQVSGGHLLFASALPDSVFDQRFGDLPACAARRR